MSRLIALGLGLILSANGLFQLAAPLAWYDAVPGVVTTGPFNAHFVRDIGAAYFVAGGGLIAFARFPSEARPALYASAAFLTLHAAIHVFDAVCGQRPLQDTLRDFAAVHLTALITLSLALAAAPNKGPCHA